MKRKFNTIEKDLSNLQTTSLLDDEDEEIIHNDKIIVSTPVQTPSDIKIIITKSTKNLFTNTSSINIPSYIN
jgi:hypothetical protein